MSRRAELASAFGLLTRLPRQWLSPDPVAPDPADSDPAASDPATSVWAYPVVGIVVGGIGGLVYWIVATVGSPAGVAAVFAIAAMVVATGAMHEDGAADTADGLGGGADKARKLEIMRDSRIGTYGVVTLVLIFALRLSAIAAIATPSVVFAVLLASAALSRGAMTAVMFLVPRARTDGLSVHVGDVDGRACAEAAAIAVLAALLVLPFAAAIAATLAAAVAAAAIAMIARAQIGGQTGDVLGAAGIAAECAVLTAVAAAFA